MNIALLFAIALSPLKAAPIDPLLQPIAPETANRWLGTVPPSHVHGNTWLVGFTGLNLALINTSDGLILVDGAVPQGVTAIKENIRKAGFRIEDVRYILSTEPHYDHSGGIAALARESDALVLAGQEAVAVLRAGRSDEKDPQFGSLPEFPAVANVRGLGNGESMTLGDTTVTAIATPGHAPGSTSWTWKSCEEDACIDVVFGASFSPLTGEHYRYSDNPRDVEAFRDSIEKFRSLPCDVLIRSHVARERSEPGGDACVRYAQTAGERLNEKLAAETASVAARK